MQHAHLNIRLTESTLRSTWDDGSGVVLERERSVHADDVHDVESALQTAPASRTALERLGARIFSRLMDRTVREAVFSSPSSLLTLTTNVPQIPWGLAFGCGRFLCEVHAVGRDGGSSEYQPYGVLRALMVVNPTGDLPYSESEAAQVCERLRYAGRVGLTTLYGAAATRNAILEALEATPFDVLHFSCHAEYDAANPLRSHIRAFDGPLTAEDLSHAALAAPPALVVLNACESGRCAGTGPASGIAAAFRAAGAASVLGTLWPVNNKAAGYLVSTLYAGIAAGEPVGGALRSARLETRRTFAFDPLQTWAAFALSGDPALRLCPPSQHSGIGRAPLVGRDREWAALEKVWDEARAGRGRAVVLQGGPGTGKTRLLEEWLASLPNADVIKLNVELAGTAGIDAGDSTAVVAAKLRAGASVSGGGIVVCDRVDDASASVTHMLDALLRESTDSGLLVLIAGRSISALSGMLAANVQQLPLGLLEPADVRRLFEALGSESTDVREMTPGEAERIALGIPAAETTGALADALPERDRDVLRASAILGEEFSASDAAVLLHTGTTDLWGPLEALCRLDWMVETEPGRFRFRRPDAVNEVRESIRPAGRRLELHRETAALFDSRNELACAAEHWLNAGERDRAYNGFIAAIETADLAAAVKILEWHALCLSAGPPPGSSDYWLSVAAALRTAGNWPSAREAYKTALGLAPSVRQRPRLLLAIGEANIHLGDLDAADGVLGELASGDADVRARSLLLKSQIARSRCRPADAMELACGALSAANESGNSTTVAEAALAGSLAALMSANPSEAIALCETGLAAAGHNSGTPAATGLLRSMARARQYAGDYESAERVLLELASEQSAQCRLEEQASTLLALADLWRDQGLLEPALARLAVAEEIAERCSLPALTAEAQNLRASVLRRQGRYPAALEAAEAASGAAATAGSVPLAIQASLQAATVYLEQGRLRAALNMAEEADRAAEEAAYGFGRAWALNLKGVALLEMGHLEGAEETLRDSLSEAEAVQGHIGIANAYLHLGWAAWAQDTPNAALFDLAGEWSRSISYRAVQYQAAFGAALCTGDLDASNQALREIEALNMGAVAAWLRQRRGAWLLARGEADAALADLASAYRVSRRLGMAAVQMRCASELARCYEASGDVERANEMRDEAAALRTAVFAD